MFSISIVVAGFEVRDELYVFIFPFLFFNFFKFVLFHSLNNFKFFSLFETLLVFVAFLHELLHIVVDVFVDSS